MGIPAEYIVRSAFYDRHDFRKVKKTDSGEREDKIPDALYKSLLPMVND